MTTKWIRKGNVEEAEDGILSNAPGRARLVTETPKAKEGPVFEYQPQDPRGNNTRSAGDTLPPEAPGTFHSAKRAAKKR